jgi:hypothetical protein
MKYLVEAPTVEAMTVFYAAEQPKLLTHKVWTGDFMAACKHDIACVVCFNESAIIERNVTPSRSSQSVQPCHKCQELGYATIKIPRWLRWLLGPKP